MSEGTQFPLPTTSVTAGSYTAEEAQDAVGGILADTATVDLTYTDAAPSITADVIDDSITNAKAANMAQSTIKGRAAGAGTGDPTDLSVAQVKTILALAAADISDFVEVAQDSVAAMVADTSTIDFTYTDGTPELKADVKASSIGTSHLSFDVATQAELDAHTGDSSDAHDASAISVDSTTLVGTGTDAQAVFEELDNAIVAAEAATAAHLADTSDAHDASAISAVSTTLVGVATDVQGVLEELDDAIADHLADSSAAHAASAVSFAPYSSLAATDVQAAIQELLDESGSGYTDEEAQDAVGGILADSSTIDFTYTDGTPEITAIVKNSSIGTGHLSFDVATQAELDAHTGDTSDAHDASAISVDSTTLVGTGTDAQAVFEELDNAIADHVADSSAAHAGTAISNTPAGNIAATTVQAAIDELDSEKAPVAEPIAAAHIADSSAAHAASAVSADSTTLVGTGTDVQAVLEELDNAIVAAEAATAAHLADSSAAHAASAVAFTPYSSLAATDVQAAIQELLDESGSGYTDEQAQDAVGAMVADTATIDVTYTDGTPELKWDVKASSIGTGHLSFDVATQAELDAHTGDTSAAHAASAISADSTTLVGTGTDVQAVLEELDNGIADHLADASDAHDASAISVDSTTLVGTGTDAQAVFEELDNAIVAAEAATAAHIADSSAAHAASAISADSTTLVGTGTDVQAVLEELDNGIADHLADATAAHAASAIDFTPYSTIAATTVQAAIQELLDESGGGGYSDEQAQDAVGAMIADTATIDLTYTDGTPELKADVINDSITYAKMQNVSATSRVLGRITSGAGDVEELTPANVKTIIGLKAPTTQVLTVGSGTYTTPAGCTAILVKMVGAGGGGGGADGNTSQASAGGGGASGGYLEKLIIGPDATYAYTVGAKGAGGTAGNNAGSDGADSTFGAGGGLLTAKGGGGGAGAAASSLAGASRGGAPGGTSTGGDLNGSGTPGQGSAFSGPTVFSMSGAGASSIWGGGATAANGNTTGANATGIGSGGAGGSTNNNTTDRAGGDGSDAEIHVTEFYD